MNPIRFLLLGWILCVVSCSEPSNADGKGGDGEFEEEHSDLDQSNETEGEEEEIDASSEGEIPESPETDSLVPPDRWGFPADHPLLRNEFLNIAHRGGGRLAPEESLEAYRKAVESGADMLEMDLHATLDEIVVLHHDATVDRMTDGTGEIKGMTFEFLQTLDAGYRFTPDGGQSFPYRGRGVHVAAFREVLEAFPEMIFSAEIKQSHPPIVDLVLAILHETGLEDRVILVSFDDQVVKEIRQKNPRIVTGAGTGEMLVFSAMASRESSDYAPPCPIFQLPDIEPAELEYAHRFDLKIQIWTINEADEMIYWTDLGVDGVMSDDPQLLESVIQEKTSGD